MAHHRYLALFSLHVVILTHIIAEIKAKPAVGNSTLLHGRVKRGTSGSRLTYEERLDFLSAHNDFRRNVDPAAADMQFMVWNEELASMAQEWADGCEWKHGQPERDSKPFDPIGQNLYVTTAAEVSGTTSTTSWNNEVVDYTYSSNSCEENKVCGHYTQVVWAKSTNLGCAVASCAEMVGISMTNAKYVVCNYGPAGNYVGQKPYTEGTSCSSCPTGTICELDLCVNDPKCGSKTCENGGTLDDACECDCPEGYDGATCSIGAQDDGTDNVKSHLTLICAVAWIITLWP